MKLTERILGRCTTVERSERQLADEREHQWRRPFETGNAGSYKAHFVLGFPPGWKLAFFHHVGIDLAPPHCHAGRLLSVILWGGYVEERTDDGPGLMRRVWRRPFSANWFPLNSYHAIKELPRGHAWTLVLMFPTVQEAQYAVGRESVNIEEYWGHAAA